VNYLAHAWVLPELEPELVLGAALPDLLGTFDRRAPRLGPDAVATLASAGRRELARGVRAHQAADGCFHALAAFEDACRALRPLAARVNASGGRVRGFFLCHLLVEVLLDHELAARSPRLAERFYESLARADHASAAAVASRAAANPRDVEGFVRFVRRFLEARFLALGDTESVVLRVGRVAERARQSLGEGAGALAAGLDEARAVVRSRLDGLVDPPRAAVLRALS
jgi:hypothetical protein